MTENLDATTEAVAEVADNGRESLHADRPQFVSQSELDEVADVFVKAMGWGNADRLSENLRYLLPASDAIKALNRALVTNFNIVRQEQIRKVERTRAGSSSAGGGT